MTGIHGSGRAKRALIRLPENVGEAGAACLLVMVQGNLFGVTLAHWAVAAGTGLLGGSLAAVVVYVLPSLPPWRIAFVLVVATAVADAIVHSGRLASGLVEALVTGAGAGALSFSVGFGLRWRRRRTAGRH